MPSRTRKKDPTEQRVGAVESRVGVVVLGMHRSGTSALTRIFNLIGCSLPANLMGANSSNMAGHWESTPICRFNDKLLESAGTDWSDWSAINPGWFRSPIIEGLLNEAAEVLEEEFGTSRLFVIKDPRICRLLPFWLEVFDRAGVFPKFAIPLRHPVEVAESLKKRNGFDKELGQLLWLRHVLDAERFSRGQPRFFCTYEQILSQWPHVAQKASLSFNVEWPRLSAMSAIEIDQFVDASLRHHSERADSLTSTVNVSLVTRAFVVFDRWASGEERNDDFAELNEVRDALDASAPLFARIVIAGKNSAAEVRALKGALSDMQKANAQAQESSHAQIKQISEKSARYQAELDELKKQKIANETAKDQLANDFKKIEQQLAAKVQELTGLKDQLSETEQQLAHSKQETRGVKDALSQTESALRQRSLEAEQTASDLIAARKDASEAVKQLVASTAHSEQLASDLGKARSEIESLTTSLANTMTALAEASTKSDINARELEEVKSQLQKSAKSESDLNAALTQTRSDADQVRAELREMAQQLQEARETRQALENDVLSAKAAAQEAADALSESREQHNALLSALDFTKQQLDETGRARALLQHELFEAKKAVKDSAEQLAENAEKLSYARQLLDDRTNELAQITLDLKTSEQAVSLLEQELSTSRSTLSEMAAELVAERENLRSELKNSEKYQEEINTLAERSEENRVSTIERNHELAALTAMLQQNEDKVAVSEEAFSNLMDGVLRLLNKRPSRLLPRALQVRQQARRLSQSGLFDAEWYLEEYEDVAKAGVDPLLHYVEYGADENRSPNALFARKGIGSIFAYKKLDRTKQ